MFWEANDLTICTITWERAGGLGMTGLFDLICWRSMVGKQPLLMVVYERHMKQLCLYINTPFDF